MYILLGNKGRRHLELRQKTNDELFSLHATHGVVGPRKQFFETAFEQNKDEFKYIIEQPEDLIFY